MPAAARKPRTDEEPPHVVERRAIRVTHALRLEAASALQLHGRARLRVAVYAEFFPVAYRRGKNKALAGFDVDLIEAFSRAAGLGPPQYVRIRDFFDAWEMPGKWADRIDVAIGGIGREKYRASPTVEWSLPYFEVRRTVVYNLADPIRRFPQDVTGVVAGTMGSTGMVDAIERLRKKFGDPGAWGHLQARWKSSDEKDVQDVLDRKIQGLMRGSFVGKAIVAQWPKRLGMAEPWDAPPGAMPPYGREVFAFPCRRGSGLAGMLNAFLVRAAQKGELAALAEKHGMA
jgi:ABC-type amino acid transport substrate-binding protein